jgi:nicotinate-nucleotide--dimethylbenzimidazole phosphoribosyltransferase
MAVSRSLIAPTSNPLLERALLEKLSRRAEAAGSLGKLEPLALRLGLMQNTLKPRLRDPQLLVFAADHGIAVDGIDTAARHPTFEQVRRLLAGSCRWRCSRASTHRADRGRLRRAENIAAHERLLMRKIAWHAQTRLGAA